MLVAAMALVIAATVAYQSYHERMARMVIVPVDSMRIEYERFMASLTKRTTSLKLSGNYSSGSKYAKHENIPLVPEPFNPNSADSALLTRMGLPRFVVSNILKYRERGGSFKSANDLSRIYGISDSLFAALKRFVVIPPVSNAEVADSLDGNLLPAKVGKHEKVLKYAEGTVVDLNLADTTELKKIPGIGSAISRMIVAYRRKLGGFYDVRQLAEININAERLLPWLSADRQDIKRIRVNSSSVESLSRHPYINFYQAKAIVEYRNRHGSVPSLKPFLLYEEFSEKDIERISPYLDFQ